MTSQRQFLATAAILVLGLGLLVYGQSLSGEFTNWDDGKLVLDNPRVTSPEICAILSPRRGETYQPIRDLSHAFDYALVGDKPLFHHLHNSLLHALASFLVILLVHQLSQRRDLALFVGLAFLLHPQNVEAVAWISSRKYGLLAVFSLLAVSANLRGWHPLAIIASLLAFLSSPIAMILPLLLLIVPAIRGNRPSRRVELGYLALAACIGLFLLWMLTGSSADPSPLKTERGFSRYISLIFAGLFEYLRATALPFRLSPHYQAAWGDLGSALRVIGALAIVVLLAIFTIRRRKRDSLPLLCFAWTLLWWLPVANIAPIAMRMADRYWYLPSIGCVLGLGLLIDRCELRKPIGIAVLVVFALLAWRQSLIWQSSTSLWESALRVEQNDPVARCNLGLARHANGDLPGAMQDWQAGLALKPDDVALNNCLGFALRSQGRAADALPLLQRAVSGDPKNSRSQWNLGKTYIELKRHADAIAPLTAAAADEPAAQFDLATALVAAGQHADAIPVLQAVIAINPDNGGLHYHLGASYLALGQHSNAIPPLERAIALMPKNRAAAATLTRARALP
ncbi:MAG: tetratricopeptide (TPR) repeat protein [Rhodothermales bacterium]|jgi:tetratricopeptide (TPR) repeat protein